MATQKSSGTGHGFGTAPVFLASISTILGAILFLRFGYAVANTGMLGSIMIILIGHAITIPTALAIAEIATNMKVGGGGEYFIVNRSFGDLVGGTIGISLYAAQAVSVAFYMIAFSNAFTPLFGWFQEHTGITPDLRMISIPAALILLIVIIKRGANIGVSILWAVVCILGASLALFFLGRSSYSGPSTLDPLARIENPDSFFRVFAIIFPAFTGMTAGVGLAGDLKNPRRSIPLGTLSGTLAGMGIYILVVIKLTYSATPQELAADQLVMRKIALWGPIIPIGLAAATISSAIGSILVAPRTMQALAGNRIFPSAAFNRFMSKGKGEANEPVNATLVTSVIVFVFVAMGSVDFVAQLISMFFMITYGTLCLVSFLQHLAGNPSYRPTFRSKWYLSLIGAIACFVMMFQMQPVYALLAVAVMVIIYLWLRKGREEEPGLSNLVKGVLFQMTRHLQILIQKKRVAVTPARWRPSFVAISSSAINRPAPFDLLRWISHYYGFGSFFHFVRGTLNSDTDLEAKRILDQLIKQGEASRASIYLDTVIASSFKSAVSQILQMPGVFGLDNNSILLDLHDGEHIDMKNISDACNLAAVLGFNICILRSSDRRFGYRKEIHIWLTPDDYRNANLMILLAYIIMGHPEWKGCEIKVFAAFHESEMDKQLERLYELVDSGRIPISRNHIQRAPFISDAQPLERLVSDLSEDADLVIAGFSLSKLEQQEGKLFKDFGKVSDIVFVRAGQQIVISEPSK